MLDQIKKAANYINNQINTTVDFAVVLGSGLGDFPNHIQITKTMAYQDIPGFPQTTVAGHKGELILGKVGKQTVLVMAGRFHYYEGLPMHMVTFPVRVFHWLGIKKLILSNASGGVNPNYKLGEIVLIKDHVNMMPEHPLRGENLTAFGPRFVDMSEPYDRQMLAKAKQIAAQLQIPVQVGNYMALQGPTFETPAEYGMVRALGCDVVGMSTVPEVIVAKHQNMRVFCLSVVTDLGGPDIAPQVSHEEVLMQAKLAQPNMIKIVKELITSNS